MNRRGFLLAIAGVATGGVVAASRAQAAPAGSAWDELLSLENEERIEDLPADDAQEAQGRGEGRGRGRGRANRGRRGHGRRGRGRAYGRRYRRVPRGRAYGYYRGPRRRRRYGRRWYAGRRRVCRLVRSRYGYLVRRCWWVW